jgi:hypothetical protein
MKFISIKLYFLFFILLFLSGNPLIVSIFGQFVYFFGLLSIISFFKLNFNILFYKKLIFIFLFLFIIAILQYFILKYISISAFINLFLKICLGGIIIYTLNDKLPFIIFKIVYFLCLISLFFYFFINIIDLNLISLPLKPFYNSYILYHTNSKVSSLRNFGMFWEPGAFAGVITLCLGVNFKYLKFYWKNFKFHLIIIIIALISTQSTTGYLIGFLILFISFLKIKNYIFKFTSLFLFLILFINIYKSNYFLKDKIESQFSNSRIQSIGAFSNTRFGSLIFDLHYIKKHPFIGNGLISKTRYSDHLYLFKGYQDDPIASGNSFTHFIASMGIFFVIAFFYFLWKSSSKYPTISPFILLVVVFFNLQSEQWYNYPLFLGLPFLNFRNKSAI